MTPTQAAQELLAYAIDTAHVEGEHPTYGDVTFTVEARARIQAWTASESRLQILIDESGEALGKRILAIKDVHRDDWSRVVAAHKLQSQLPSIVRPRTVYTYDENGFLRPT